MYTCATRPMHSSVGYTRHSTTQLKGPHARDARRGRHDSVKRITEMRSIYLRMRTERMCLESFALSSLPTISSVCFRRFELVDWRKDGAATAVVGKELWLASAT